MLPYVQTGSLSVPHTAVMPNGVFASCFTRAAEKLGGVAELATFLQASVETVEHWLRGTMHPPVSAFLRVVDLITPKNPFDPHGR